MITPFLSLYFEAGLALKGRNKIGKKSPLSPKGGTWFVSLLFIRWLLIIKPFLSLCFEAGLAL
jgi:hypothetical protein